MCSRRRGPGARPPDLVEVVEGGAVLVELLLADPFGVARQDLVLHLVDGSGDGGQQLLPAHAKVLQGREPAKGDGERRGEEKGLHLDIYLWALIFNFL